MHFGQREYGGFEGMMKLFPFFPLVFPIGLFLTLMGLMTLFSYLSYKELASHTRTHTHGTPESHESLTS